MEALLATGDAGDGLEEVALPALHDDVLLLVHPWFAPTFSTVIDPEWDTDSARGFVENEIRLVLGDTDPWMTHYEYVGTIDLMGSRFDRILVTCLPKGALKLRDILHTPRLEVRSTLGVIAELIIHRQGLQSDREHMTVGVGWYGTKAEICAVSDGVLRCSGFATFESAAEGWEKLDSFVKTFGGKNPNVTDVLLYGPYRSTDHEKEISSVPLFSSSIRDRLVPSDIFQVSDREVTRDPMFGLPSAGVMSSLLSKV